jgi:hypothetical protein
MIYYVSYMMYIWRLYRSLMIIHGIYVSLSMMYWLFEKTNQTFVWIVSWLPQPLSQIEDKKYENKKYIEEEVVEGDFDNKYTLLSQS